ncbi:thioesterase domain-containing protein [Kitasatospora terrestris]|uniref:Carrier domain-containing protein n=1 Tax=Kitasatospora terrestris TaxID=258051 RepID=A0ABP9D8F1_9ACTN
MTSASGSCQTIERTLRETWADLFGAEVSPYDDFFEIGGNSLRVVDAVIAARQRGIALRSSAVFRNPTPARLAESLTLGAAGEGVRPPAALTADSPAAADPTERRRLTRITTGEGSPVFLVHSDRYAGAERAAALGWCGGRPVHGLVLPGTDGTDPWEGSLTGLAEAYAAELLEARPEGGFALVGVAAGAVLAFETARVLRARSAQVSALVMIRPDLPGQAGPAHPQEALEAQLARVARLCGLGGEESGEQVLARLRAEGWYDGETPAAELPRLQRASAALAVALAGYRPRAYDGPVLIVQDERDAGPTEEVWGPVLEDDAVHWTDYGVESPGPLLADPEIARITREELAR